MTEDILLEHFSRYPQMKPQDAVKLLYQMEFVSSRLSQGDKRRFRRSLDALRSLADQDETPFDPVELDLFLARYPDSLPAVHHSEAYRNAYRPAYRVVSQKKVKDYLARKRAEEANP